MKTAMQELIDELKELKSLYASASKIVIQNCISLSESKIEKEKEQMLNFYMWMRMNENAEKYFHYSDEDMFAEYLNQNK